MTAISSKTLADQIEDRLPQTQCTKCGYPACRPYAEAIAAGEANYNQCPPGGQEGVVRLASLLGMPVIALNPDNGLERPRPLAIIDENLCIGCTLCLQACPVDAIIGAAKQMHTIIPELCTGCDLCVPPCPVDCIAMVPVTGEKTGWDAWSQQEADAARERHDLRQARLARERDAAEARKAARMAEASDGEPRSEPRSEPGTQLDTQPDGSVASKTAQPATTADDDAQAKKRAIIQAAMDRARQKKEELARLGAGPKNIDAVSPEVQAQIDAAEARRRRLGMIPTDDDKSSTPAAEPDIKPDNASDNDQKA
ncbi:electron transport complex subunit RsxB [Burkholderia sp. S171]|uniref:electron transport complex subunit RsxB n=1 Tax=Burkholderia sp. S171 TaxID=1641860 RepID=UPI00131E90A6|nr:electron transport complex subunit RsxB [Burkholderia sp. S171]